MTNNRKREMFFNTNKAFNLHMKEADRKRAIAVPVPLLCVIQVSESGSH